MITRLIEKSARNPVLVILGVLLLAAGGVWLETAALPARIDTEDIDLADRRAAFPAVGMHLRPVESGQFAVPLGQEEFRLRVLEERILVAGEQGSDIPTQRRDPERVPRVESVGQVDEALEVLRAARRVDAHDSGQMTPSSRPMRAKASSE